jgi:hypothetical protein
MILLQGVSPAVKQKLPVWHSLHVLCSSGSTGYTHRENFVVLPSLSRRFLRYYLRMSTRNHFHLTQHEILSTFYIATLSYQASSQNISSQNCVYSYWSVRGIWIWNTRFLRNASTPPPQDATSHLHSTS